MLLIQEGVHDHSTDAGNKDITFFAILIYFRLLISSTVSRVFFFLPMVALNQSLPKLISNTWFTDHNSDPGERDGRVQCDTDRPGILGVTGCVVAVC